MTDSYMLNVTSNLANTTQYHTTQLPQTLLLIYLPSVVSVPLLGLPANALVIRHLLGKPGICSTSETFTLNLAIFDLLFCLIICIEYAVFFSHPSLASAEFLSWGLNQFGGPLLLCCLCLDTYLAVCHPLAFLRLKAPKFRLTLCFAVCVATIGFCLSMKISRKQKWTVITALLVVAMVITSACNILVLRSLRQSGPGRREVHPVKKRAFKIVLTVFMLINVHYMPTLLEYLLRQYVPNVFSPHSPLTWVTITSLSMSSFIQPMCYLIRTKKLRKMKCHCGSMAKTPPSPIKTVATL